MAENTYNQKYLDEKFSTLNKSVTQIKTLLESQQQLTNAQHQTVLDKIAELDTRDQLIDRDVKDLTSRVGTVETLIDKGNFFSVKGVLFVITIFAILMTAFLLNGVALLDKAV